MHRPLILAAVAALVLLPGSELAGQRQGTFLEPTPDQPTTRVAQRGANFLAIGVGARARGMGEAATGIVDGAAAMYWNPAGLAVTDGFTAAFTHTRLYDDLDIDHSYAGVALPFAGGAAGVSYIRLDSGDIPRTTVASPGGGDATVGNTFSWSSTALGLHYGRRLTDRLQVGFTGRVITEGIAQANITWWGVDVGTVFNTGLYGITLAGVIANVGPTARFEGGLIQTRVATDQAFPFSLPLRFATTEYQLPTTFRFAVVSELLGGADALLAPNANHSLRLASDLNDAVDTDIQMSVGAEYSFRDFVYLRAGKKFVNEGNDDFRSASEFLSFGGGLRFGLLGRHLSLDYAYTNMGELQNVQVFSFELGN